MLIQTLLDVARTSAAQAPAPQGNAFSMVLMIVVMFAIVYFLMIRPQQKQQKKHRDFLSKLRKGDEVVTQSGILGKVFAVEENVVTLELSRDVRIRVLKHAVANIAPGTEPSGADADKK